MKNKKQIYVRGQALIMLVSFIGVGIAIITNALLVNLSQNSSVSGTQQGALALEHAESGAENAILRLLRDPYYTGEVLTVGSGTVTTTVTGSSPSTIISSAVVGQFKKTITVIIDDSNNQLNIISWKEQ